MLKLNHVKKSFLIVIILGMFLTACGFVSAQDICLNDTVQNEAIDDIELNSQSATAEDNLKVGTFSEIMDKINNAQEGEVIELDKDLYIGDGHDISFSKSVTIQSANSKKTVLDGQNLSYIMFIAEGAKNTVIKNIEFKNGNSAGMGGAVISKADSVLFDNCIFHNNKASYGGGAIALEGKYTTISSCEFYENEANGGGAVYTSYEGSKNGAGDYLKIINCNFHNNLAYTTAGAVGIYGNHSEIRKSVFNSNKVVGKNGEVYGGAIQIGMDDHYIVSNCSDCQFINNSAVTESPYTSHGGAGCIRNGIIFDGCRFILNTADQGGALTYHSGGIIKNCIFENNEALKLYGGALSTGYNVYDMNLKIENVTFNTNKAPLGGAVFLIGENVTVDDCQFSENSAIENGGAVYIKAETTTVKNSKFNSNLANVNGGAIYINATVTSIENNDFEKNRAIPDPKLLNDGLGGAIFIDSSQSLIKNNRYNLNVARNGSAIYISTRSSESIISNNTFNNNQAWVYQLVINGPEKPLIHGQTAIISSTIHGGNNIGNFSNIFISNAIYNAASNNYIVIDGTLPLKGATDSGLLYQDDREYNMDINLKITHEDGTVAYHGTLKSNAYGNVDLQLENLKPGVYTVVATHDEDTYYKAISNMTKFVVLPVVDAEILKTSDSEEYNYRDMVEWKLTITNNGPDKATNVRVYDELPDSLVYISDDGNGKYDFRSGVWNVGELDVGETQTLIIKTMVNTTGKIVNKASVTSNEYDSNMANNEDNRTIVVNPAADLKVVKKVNNSNPNFGDLITWTIEVTNNGPDTATGVIVKDIIPEGLIFIRSSGNYTNGTWNIDKLAVGETIKLEIICKINKTGEFTNIVTVNGTEYDFNKTNNEDNETIMVNSSADLIIIKKVDNTNPNYLDVVTWTIEVINNGPDTATNVKMVDLLPEGLVILDWDCEGEFKNNIWNIGDIELFENKLYQNSYLFFISIFIKRSYYI